MAYREPTDRPQVPPAWSPWPLADRLRAAFVYDAAPAWARHAAVAITMVEQPGKIPNGNCCGLMSQGPRKPWGWRLAQWTDNTMPTGYALIREGLTGLAAPFLAFDNPAKSLAFLIDRCVARGIFDGDTYARLWVGVKATDKQYADSVAAYTRQHDRVHAELWALAAKCAALPLTGGDA